LHKCWEKSVTGPESVAISVLKKFIEVEEVAVAVAEVDMFLDMMVHENKILIDESFVYSIW